MTVFQQIYQFPNVTAEPILECFNVLVQNKLYEVALQLGSHLLKVCEKFVVGVEMQKKFLLKFLFVFDRVEGNSKLKEETIKQLVECLTSIVTLQFVKALDQEEVKVVFFAAWNIAYEAKQHSLCVEAKQMLQSLYEIIKKFACFVQEQGQGDVEMLK